MNELKTDNTLLLPSGVSEMTPVGADLVRRMEEKMLEVFRLWGYQEIRTPSLEYLDTMSLGLTGQELDMAFKLVDRETGKIMLLRSDATPQVARMVSRTLSGNPLPMRLCYVTNVYRHPDDPSHPRREMIQAGVELVGIDDPQADAEVLAVGFQALRDAGFTGLRMSVGQVQYARALLREASFERTLEDAVVEAACRKDRSRMMEILRGTGVPAGVREGVMALTELSGRTDILLRARETAPNDEARRAIDDLEAVLELAGSYGVPTDLLTVDLGDLTSFRYHTGAVFTAFVSGAGRAVLKGGRYDNLTEKYGRKAPATGFAIDLLEVVEIASAQGPVDNAIDYLLVNRTGEREKGLRISVELRKRGHKVLCLIRDIPDKELGAYAAAHRVAEVLILDEEGLAVLDTVTYDKKTIDINVL